MGALGDALVTVAIPTRNRSGFLRECLASILDQSLEDIEIWVSDNASTDDTSDVVASFGDPRLHHDRLDRNIGLFGNLSRSLKLGSAPYLTFLPDDALMLPENLKRKVGILEAHPQVDIVHSADRILHLDSNGGAVEIDDRVFSSADLIERNSIALRRLLTESYGMRLSGAVVRRTVIGDDRFDEKDGPPADLGLCLRLTSRARSVGYIPKPLMVGRAHPDDASVKDYQIWQLDASGHRYAPGAVALSYKVMERFLREHAQDLPDVRQLEREVLRSHRRSLMFHMRKEAGIERSRRATWRLLREAYRADPRLVPSRAAMRFLVGGLMGQASRRFVRTWRPRHEPASAVREGR